MATLDFILDGELVNPPMNWKEVEVEFSFENDSPSASLSTTQFDFVAENVEKIKAWIDGGMNGTRPGIFEGMPLQIMLNCEKEGQINLFSGYLDLAADSAAYQCDEYSLPFVESGGIDWLRNVSDSFSFAYLYSIGVITQADFIPVNYVVAGVPDFLSVAMLSVTTYLVLKEVKEAVRLLAEAITNFISAVTDTIGATLRGIAKLIITLIYFVAIMIAVIALLKQIAAALFPIPRYYYGMKYHTLFERACKYLDLKFSSTILTGPYKDLLLLPAKFEPGATLVSGSKDVGYPEKTFGQLITEACTLFNARVRVINGTLHLERKDFFRKKSGVSIPDTQKVARMTNAAEVPANFFLRFQLDGQDENTYAGRDGGLYQVTIAPKLINSSKNRLLKNLDERSFPYSRAVRKTSTTTVEAIFGGIYDVFATLAGLIGGSNSFPRIGSRTNFMKLTADFFGVDKLIIMKGGGLLSPENETLLSCKYLWDNYHFIDSPVPQTGNPSGNQWEKYKDVLVELCCADILKLKNNNVIEIEALGREAIVKRCKYNIHNQTAKIDYEVNKVYTKNLTEHKKDGIRK